ncbi:hypothetical protein ACFU6R_02760 [Streptomyces sp. NPDC057499]
MAERRAAVSDEPGERFLPERFRPPRDAMARADGRSAPAGDDTP